MNGKKIKNPLGKRVPRELIGEWKKYAVVGLFLILTVGFVSGMYVANDSMLSSAEKGVTEYKLEYGHFELSKKLSEETISAIETGEKANIKNYYLDKAKKEFDEKFPAEFEKEFTEKFNEEFTKKFDEQLMQTLLAQGLDEVTAEAVFPETSEQARQSEDYKNTYDEAYKTAYDEAYRAAYDEAWEEVRDEVESEYAEAEEKYDLNSSDFKAVPIKIYENFFKNAEEDNNCDGVNDGTVRVFAKTEEINLACLMEGKFPENESEIAIDRMHADNVGVSVGDEITVSGNSFKIVGTLAYVNYSTLHEKNTDFMFDALKFNTAMVTAEGFERINKPVHFNYAWLYENPPEDEKEEKIISDNLMRAALTQTVVSDNEIEDFLPRYANNAVNFATSDMGSDKAMGGTLLNILILIIAFIFAVTISNTIAKESSVIGTLRASGYTRGELVRHYLSMPVIVTLISAALGNILGYTVFKNVVVSMYYNSYSLPKYYTVWNAEAFVKTTAVPIAIMLVINLLIIAKNMRRTPLQFLRHDLKKSKRKKAIRLPKLGFLSRFRLRVMLQNIPNYLILFFGIFFISVMLSMAVGMPSSLAYYKENAKDNMFANYQYILKSYEDEDGNIIGTENPRAEKFAMTSLVYKGEEIDEEVSVYGISENSNYVGISELENLKENEVYISNSFAEKYRLKKGDAFTLEAKYENINYEFTAAGIYDKSFTAAAFMPIENYRKTFEINAEEFTGFMSDEELDDLDVDSAATVITERDITKMCDQLDHSMGSYMRFYQVLCILLSAVLIYLLTKIIIEKNQTAISMTKILG
ncbi:MAG: ABC transporter permease, partial [Muribaculaceae bacterium]|nr:ABC transporter permease [Muribaculaceae bacterium]